MIKEVDFFDLLYADRQMVIFEKDDVVSEYNKCLIERQKLKDSPVDYACEKLKDIWNNKSKTGILGTLILPIPFKTALITFKTIANLVHPLIIQIGNLNVYVLPISSCKSFKCLPGHPQEGVLYVGNPMIRNQYVPMTDFHRLMIEQKYAELINLLMKLGATKIKVEYIRGFGKEFSGNVGLGGVDAKAEYNSRTESSIILEVFFKGNLEPELPADMHWYDSEPMWKQVALGRIEGGLENFNIEFNYSNDYSVNGELLTKVKDAKLSVGGDFQGHQNTLWKVSGTFLVNS